MTTERELREKLRKIAALFEGASTAGEREAAAAARKRVLAALNAAEKVEPTIEMQFSLSDRWSRLLFTALCRRYKIKPYRYPRQRYTTVVVRAPRRLIENTLWPEYLELKAALDCILTKRRNESSAKRYSGMPKRQKNAQGKNTLPELGVCPGARRASSRWGSIGAG